MSKTKNLALTAIFAALYYVLGVAFHPISFGAVQCRIASALIPLIVIFGSPSIIGLTIGGLLFNMSSPLGGLDLLSMFLFIPAKLAINKWGLRAIPLHILSVGLWVAFMLNTLYGLPFIATAFYIMIGEGISEIVLGLPLYYGLLRRGFKNAEDKDIKSIGGLPLA